MLRAMHVLRSENMNAQNAKHDEYSSFSKRESPIAHIYIFIIQQIVTLSKYGHDALDICHP